MPNKILVVDDDREFRNEFKICFNEYDIIDVGNGKEALNLLKKSNDIDLVILDVNMPGASGTDVLTEIKAIDPHLAVIILTGHSSENVAISSLKAHADDYMEKPFDIDIMRDAMENLLDAKIGAKDNTGTDKIQRVQAYVNRNCYKKVLLSEAAQSVSLSPKYLSRVFKLATGMGFNEYRLKIQVDKAKELLTKRLNNVSQIADRLGYKNPESFIRQFKKITKQTPTEYRAAYKKKENRKKR